MTENNSTCKNCEQSISTEAKFCAGCGQNVISLRRPLWPVVKETVHESLDIDGRLMLTLKTLILSPGKLTLDYDLGKRAKYTPPLRMYIVISILFFLILSQIDLSDPQVSFQTNSVNIFLPRIMFLLLPIFAFLLRVIYPSTYYISNLVFSVHIHCFAYMMLAILLPLESIEDEHILFLFIQMPFLAYLVYYIAMAIKLFYAQNWLKTIVKSFSLIIVYLGLVIISIKLTIDYFAISQPY